MKNFQYKLVLLSVLLVLVGLTGCFNKGSDSLATDVKQDYPVADVSFVIAGSNIKANTLRASGEQPGVTFELKLIDKQSSNMPVVRLRKVAQVSADGDSYNATVKFEDVPALPCLAKMAISNGSIIDAADSKPYSTWVGLKNLVPSSENSIELFGKGSQVASEVAAVLLDELTEADANVATLPEPLIAKVEETVAEMDLTDADVYENSLTSFNQQWAPDAPPEDAEFDLPTGYTSVAFPASDSAANLTISNFNSDSEVYLVLMNRGTSYATPEWFASKDSANIRANPVFIADNKGSKTSATDEYDFHLWLRRVAYSLPAPEETGPLIRSSLRAVAYNTPDTFQAHLSSGFANEIDATCKKIADIPGTTKQIYYFVDDNDLGRSNLSTVLDAINTNWMNIYETNRSIFGSEPEGTLNNGINAQNFYIFLSSRLYTAGYFYSGDLVLKAQVSGGYSNQRKMFYLQYPDASTDLDREISDLSSTMAHEFQHMIHYYQKRNLYQVTADFDYNTWIDEAMSGYAEYINGYKIENGMNQSKALQSNKYFSRISSIRLDNWHLDGDLDDNVHAHYGKAYLFGVWLAQNYGTSGAVANLLSHQELGVEAVEAFTGESFEQVAAKFLMAMQVNDSRGGVYGIKNLDLNSTYSFGDSWAPVTLTGPKTDLIDFSGPTSGSRSVAPFAATYAKITGGTGTNLNLDVTLPNGVSVFQLKKN
jgi:hypothetical protein